MVSVDKFLREEPVLMIAVRVRTLLKAKYPSFALNLLRWCACVSRLQENVTLRLLHLRVLHQLSHSRKFEKIVRIITAFYNIFHTRNTMIALINVSCNRDCNVYQCFFGTIFRLPALPRPLAPLQINSGLN